MSHSEDETERLLTNWALYRGGAASIFGRNVGEISSAYDPELARRAKYRDVAVPVLTGEAIEVDLVIASLPNDQRVAIDAQYRNVGPHGELIPSHFSQAAVAEELGYSTRTYERHLQAARRGVWSGYQARRIARAAGSR